MKKKPRRAAKPAPKKAAPKKAAPKKTAPKKAAKKPTAKKVARTKPPEHVPTPDLFGWITHTELNSADPDATKAWCAAALGWKFKPSFPTPDGDYHLFYYSDQGGGGIRKIMAAEIPGTTPYVHVADTQAVLDKAVAAGAEVMMPFHRVMEGVSIAIVKAPGGVPIGLAGP